MADREQTRRDAETAIDGLIRVAMLLKGDKSLRADARREYETLKAELEQAERERDELDRACESWKRRAVSLEQEVAARETALTQIIDLSLDEHGGLNFASRVSAIARETLTS